MRAFVIFMFLLFGVSRLGAAPITWLHDERVAFAKAKTEQRFVLLYLEAVWCHWCHVMDHDTYGAAPVQTLLESHYVTLRIDQDSRPDLANRYRDYGWPATIVFAADGTEIVKRRGFVSPERFAKLLQAIIDDPSPEQGDQRDADASESANTSGVLADALREELKKRHHDSYDVKLGGLNNAQKYLDRGSIEWALQSAAAGDAQEAKRARQTLDAALALLDPVWGGFYQYSTHSDWQHPHFEKLSVLQGDYLRIYAMAYAQFGEVRYLQAARAVQAYAENFLRDPKGGYRASQDADVHPGEHSAEYYLLDDKARRQQGVPRVAPDVYARETGALIEGLATLAEFSGDATALTQARAAANWALSARARGDGGFNHAAKDSAGPYLGDSLRMGRAFLALYRADGDRRWLTHAAAAARFIEKNFKAPQGYRTAVPGESPIAPVPQLEENIELARFSNLLQHYTGEPTFRATSEHAFAWLARRDVALATFTEAGILLLDRELAADPLHLTVLGQKDDPQASKLYRAALAQPGWYKRVEWWDRREGVLPNADVKYPPLKRAAAFVCSARQCSLPLFQPAAIAEFLSDDEDDSQ